MRAVARRDRVVPRIAVDQILAGAAEDLVVAGAAVELVVACASQEEVAAAVAAEHVVAAQPTQRVAACSAEQRVGAGVAGLGHALGRLRLRPRLRRWVRRRRGRRAGSRRDEHDDVTDVARRVRGILVLSGDAHAQIDAARGRHLQLVPQMRCATAGDVVDIAVLPRDAQGIDRGDASVSALVRRRSLEHRPGRGRHERMHRLRGSGARVLDRRDDVDEVSDRRLRLRGVDQDEERRRPAAMAATARRHDLAYDTGGSRLVEAGDAAGCLGYLESERRPDIRVLDDVGVARGADDVRAAVRVTAIPLIGDTRPGAGVEPGSVRPGERVAWERKGHVGTVDPRHHRLDGRARRGLEVGAVAQVEHAGVAAHSRRQRRALSSRRSRGSR